MDNHYHLLIHTPRPNLGKAMRHLDGVYTQRLNRSHNRDGPLFRGRYKSILIEEDYYLLQVSRYIHLNPVEANICKAPEQYAWSSLQFYAGMSFTNHWLKTNFILNLINNKNSTARNKYIAFVKEGIDVETKKFYCKPKIPSIMGTELFIHEKLKKLSSHQKEASQPDVRRLKELPSIEKIINIMANHFKANEKEITKPNKGKKNNARILAILFSRRMGHSHAKIAASFGVNSISVGKSIMRWEQLVNQNESLRKTFSILAELMEVA